MNLETYSWGAVSEDGLRYTFTSNGPKGDMPKVIYFVETENPLIYHLAFGDPLRNGEIDDRIRSDNGDRDKILATVSAAVMSFCIRYEDQYVFFVGSTPARTRSYRMALTLFMDELSEELEIFGVCKHRSIPVTFERGVEYRGFFVKRKRSKLDV